MKKKTVLFLAVALFLSLFTASASANTPARGVELECCSIIELVSGDRQIGAIRVSNDETHFAVETYLWFDTMKMVTYHAAAANDVSGLPSSPTNGPLSVSRTVTSSFTNQIDFFSYSGLNSEVITLTVKALVQDENGQLITAWGRGVPMTGSSWLGYFEYAKRTGCPPLEVPPPVHEPSSPRTIGYWKTHAGFNGNNEDVVTQYLPISLGTIAVNTAADAVNVLTFKTFSGGASNGYNKLAAQLLGAKLNGANGANISSVAGIILSSDAVLATAASNPWSTLSKSQQAYVLTLMSTLDEYNNSEF